MGVPTLTVKRNTLRFITALMLLDMTLMLSIMAHMDMADMAVITSVKLRLAMKDTPLDQSAMTRRTNSATRSPSIKITRNARKLWTPPTLRSVRRLCTLTVRKNTSRFPTAAMLLVMTLMWSTMGMVDMEGITRHADGF